MKTRTNLIIFVTQRGTVFNRTGGRNDHIQYGMKYSLGTGGYVVFSQENQKTVVTRYTVNNTEGYRVTIKDTGLLIVTNVFVQPLPKTAKEVRLLYNKVKEIFGKINFKIEEIEELTVPYRISLTIKNKFGKYEPWFTIRVNPNKLTLEAIEEAEKLFTQVAELDLRLIEEFILIQNQAETYFTLNQSFIRDMQELQTRRNQKVTEA